MSFPITQRFFLQSSWDAITPTAIQNCFRKAGFEKRAEVEEGEENAGEHDEESDNSDSDDDIDVTAALDCPPGAFDEVTERWGEIQHLFDTNLSFEEFVEADDFAPVCEVQTVQEIIAALRKDTEVRKRWTKPNHKTANDKIDPNTHFFFQEDVDDPDPESADDGAEDEEGDAQPVTRSHAMESLDIFRRYAGQQIMDGEIFQLLNKIENLTISAACKRLKQSTLDNYFTADD